ncbi:MAG TPA: DUF2339 domain-containing protein [Rhizomicrobium sp.]|nr:DUF2339 domain-containing protein [Rhizomicrobium sp.]
MDDIGDYLLLGIVAIAFVISIPISFIASMTNRRAIAELRRTLERQRLEIEALKKGQAAAPQAPVQTPAPAIATPPKQAALTMPTPQTPPAAPPAEKKKNRQKGIERQFGGRAFVWLGGVALALAGFFLVKYSIETGLLTEEVRVVLGVLFGIALLAASQAVRARKTIADGTRIAQALAGAGIADLYGSLFAATTLYHMLPSWLGFAAMAGVTALALVLSLRYGAPIAALGLIGGYATPLMIQGEPNAPALFGYLYLVFGSLSFVIRRQNWAWLSIPATIVAFAWVVLWLFDGLAIHDGAWLSLFLLGIGATAAAGDRNAAPAPLFGRHFWLRYLAPAGSLLLMATVAYASDFGFFEWALFGLFSAGAIVLAWFDNRTYVFVPWLALAANLIMLFGWEGAAPTDLAWILGGFALLFAASGQLLLSRSENPISWAGLSATTALAYFLLAYECLNDSLVAAVGRNADAVWAAIAVAASALLTLATTRAFVMRCEIGLRHRLQAIFAVAATALLSIGFAILLRQEFLAFAIAAQVLTICWINTRTDIPALRWIAQALSIVFILLLLPELSLLAGSALDDIAPTRSPDTWHLVSTLLFRYGFPSAMFAGASLLLRRQRDDEFVKALELGAVALFSIMTFKLVEIVFLGYAAEATLLVRAVFTNILLLLALAALDIARRFDRIAVFWGGAALAGLALARVVGFALLLDNPLWTHNLVGAWPVFNGLLLAYAAPAFLSLVIARELARIGRANLAWGASIAAYVLAFIYVSLNVRQFYAGAYLDRYAIGNAEVYTYSAVWLAIGVALLLAAVLRKDVTMRVASLAVMLLTVGKVFLYDASQLTGLWRVVSFLGLGLCLLGLSWFYSRFIFTPSKAAA